MAVVLSGEYVLGDAGGGSVADSVPYLFNLGVCSGYSPDLCLCGGSSASTYGQVFLSPARDNERQRQPYADERAGHGEYSFAEQNATMLNGYVTGEDTVLPAMRVGRHMNDVVGLDDSINITGTEAALYGESEEQVVQFLKYAHSDSFVSNCKGRNRNHGREKTLEVRHYLDRACVDRRALLRFNMADFSPNSVRHAEILVRASHFDRRYTVHVLGPTNNDWLETGVTWRTSPTTEWTKDKGEGGGGYATAGADAGAGAYQGKADGGQLRGRPICRSSSPFLLSLLSPLPSLSHLSPLVFADGSALQPCAVHWTQDSSAVTSLHTSAPTLAGRSVSRCGVSSTRPAEPLSTRARQMRSGIDRACSSPQQRTRRVAAGV